MMRLVLSPKLKSGSSEPVELHISTFQWIIFKLNGYVHIGDEVQGNVKQPIYLLRCEQHGYYEAYLTNRYFTRCPVCDTDSPVRGHYD